MGILLGACCVRRQPATDLQVYVLAPCVVCLAVEDLGWRAWAGVVLFSVASGANLAGGWQAMWNLLCLVQPTYVERSTVGIDMTSPSGPKWAACPIVCWASLSVFPDRASLASLT
jgi:hypothetical protein